MQGFFEKAKRRSSARELYAKSVAQALEEAVSTEMAKRVAGGESVRHVNVRSDVLSAMFDELSDEEKAMWRAKAKEALPKKQERNEEECLAYVTYIFSFLFFCYLVLTWMTLSNL